MLMLLTAPGAVGKRVMHDPASGYAHTRLVFILGSCVSAAVCQVLEETPSPLLDDVHREELAQAAVRLGQAAKYR
jgi:biotin carboxylase